MVKKAVAGSVVLFLFLSATSLVYAAMNKPGPADALVTIDSHTKYQIIDGLGGNYAEGRFSGAISPEDATIGSFMLNQLNPSYVRIGIPLAAWEPTENVFSDNGSMHDLFVSLKDLTLHHARIVASIWDAPDWMIDNASRKSSRVVGMAHWAAAIQSIAMFLTHARDNYGVSIDYISFNEANVGSNIYWDPLDYAKFIAQAGPVFDLAHLATRWLVGDITLTRTAVDYLTTMLNYTGARPYLGPIAFHSWNYLGPAQLEAIAQLGERYQKPIWCTEVGTDSRAWQENPTPFSSWDYALTLAEAYSDLLRYAHISVGLYWQYQNDYSLAAIGQSVTPYAAFYAVKQLEENLPPASQILDAQSTDQQIQPLAAQSATHFMVQVLNTGDSPRRVAFKGLPAGSLKLWRTSQSEQLSYGGTVAVSAGSLTIVLPAHSISTLTTLDLPRVSFPPAPVEVPPLPIPTQAGPAGCAPAASAASSAELVQGLTVCPDPVQRNVEATVEARSVPGAVCTTTVVYPNGFQAASQTLKVQRMVAGDSLAFWQWLPEPSVTGQATATITCRLGSAVQSRSKQFTVM